jgi:hypothetical protein
LHLRKQAHLTVLIYILYQKAKRHLEEELRADIEEKQHVIEALQTKVSLLKSGGKNVIDDSQKNDSLVDVSDTGIDTSLIKPDADKVATLEGMILSFKVQIF